jgi:hypothetical protein
MAATINLDDLDPEQRPPSRRSFPRFDQGGSSRFLSFQMHDLSWLPRGLARYSRFVTSPARPTNTVGRCSSARYCFTFFCERDDTSLLGRLFRDLGCLNTGLTCVSLHREKTANQGYENGEGAIKRIAACSVKK